MTSKHALTRTSPKGGPFIGTCIRCGEKEIPLSDMCKPCKNTGNISQDEALMKAITG